MTFWIVVLTIVVALIFDVINGFHDAANSIATVVSTRVLKPRTAVIWAAFFNAVAMFILAPNVADTISKIVKIESSDPVYITVIFSGLIGAIIWNLITWRLGLPTSSSHALIGGLSGAGVAYAGLSALRWDLLILTIEYIAIAPIIGLVLGFALVLITYWLCQSWRPATVDTRFRIGQLFSAALYSIGHGANDAQKAMGVILALLIASGYLSAETRLSLLDPNTMWIIVACHAAMALGTAMGGWRIVKTMGMKITKLRPIGGFCAETAGAFTLFFATHFGIPVSTTHTITGSIIGVGAATTTFSRIKWGVATRILWGWVLTIPGAAIMSAICFYLLT